MQIIIACKKKNQSPRNNSNEKHASPPHRKLFKELKELNK